MFDTAKPRWRKLDNAGLAFPAASGKRNSRVFRFYCLLHEEIQPEILQEALEETVRSYPVFQAVLRKGLFWYYLEQRELRPLAMPEVRPPCSGIYVPDAKRLLFQVSYHCRRINFEVFHGLTDGTGATQFIRELVKNYLYLAHPGELSGDTLLDESMTVSDQAEDSFSQHYSNEQRSRKKKKEKALQLSGPKREPQDMEILECVLSVQETLAKAREYGTTLTAYLSAVLLFAIHQEQTEKKEKRPVTLMVPINLRNYFPSDSMANFFGWMEVGYRFQRDTAFEEVLERVKEIFREELQKERIAQRMNDLISLEKNPFLRAVPLAMKNLFLQAGTSIGSRSITATFSNMSVVKMPEAYVPYIDRFGVFASTEKFQLCSCSFGEKLVLGFTSQLVSPNIQRNFLEILKGHGLTADLPKPDFPGKTEQPAGARRFFQWFTFLCIAAAVVSAMICEVFTPGRLWWVFAACGAASCWCAGAIAYYKRRNLLKTGIWQMVAVSIGCLFWDLGTGWRGWSVDYVLPLAALTMLVSVSAAARIRQLEAAEYLIYQLLAMLFGILPAVLLALQVVRVRYPSVLCAGCSFLALAYVGIFRWRELLSELHKRFRV